MNKIRILVKAGFLGLVLCFAAGTALGRVVLGGDSKGKEIPWKVRSYAIALELDTLGLVEAPVGGMHSGQRVLPLRGRVGMVWAKGGASAKAARMGENPERKGVKARGGGERDLEVHLEGAWTVNALRWEGMELPFEHRDGVIRFRVPVVQDTLGVYRMEVDYSGYLIPAVKPPWQDGVVVARDSLGFPWLGMTCQGSGARSWWPCLDQPALEPDSVEFSMTFPNLPGLDLISNGQRIADVRTGNRRRVTWKSTQPLNLYNVTFYLGRYERLIQTYVDLRGKERDLVFWVLPEDKNRARTHLAQAVDMMACFEDKLGPYPWWSDGYQVVQAPYLGMEHQSAIAYGNGFRNNEWGFDFILVHESGHEWWGNSVTATDPAYWWIHEGLTTLMEPLFLECRDGHRRESDAYMAKMRRKILSKSPIEGKPGVRHRAPDADMYYKGAWMFYSLRNSVNKDSLWYAALGSAYQKFAMRTITSEQMVNHWAQVLGPRYGGTLRWWLRHAQLPVLEWEPVVKEDASGLRLRYRWSSAAKNFYLPMQTASGLLLDPVPGRWQELNVPGKTDPKNLEAELQELEADINQLTQRYLLKIQRN